MPTSIYQTEAIWRERHKPFENGVDPSFAEANPNWKEMNVSNRLCWNCQDCSNCMDCIDCINCTDCVSCKGCWNCNDCRSCTGCTYCIDCMNSHNCRNCVSRRNYRNVQCSPFPPPSPREKLIKELKDKDMEQYGFLTKTSDYYAMQASLMLAERRVLPKQNPTRDSRRVDPNNHNTDLVFGESRDTRVASRPPSYELPEQPPGYRSPPSYRQTRSEPRKSSGKRRQKLWKSAT
jgi:hypothetical protein